MRTNVGNKALMRLYGRNELAFKYIQVLSNNIESLILKQQYNHLQTIYLHIELLYHKKAEMYRQKKRQTVYRCLPFQSSISSYLYDVILLHAV